MFELQLVLINSSFLIVVLGTYKQIRNQNTAIMSDFNEDNFDRAFELLRPGKSSWSPYEPLLRYCDQSLPDPRM